MRAAGPVATRLVQGVTAGEYTDPGLRSRSGTRAPVQAGFVEREKRKARGAQGKHGNAEERGEQPTVPTPPGTSWVSGSSRFGGNGIGRVIGLTSRVAPGEVTVPDRATNGEAE